MPALYQRLASGVEAHQLATARDMHLADVWLRGHDIPSAHRHPALAGRGLLVPTGPGGLLVVARLGQWLVRDLTIGDFAVVDDDVFHAVHRLSDLTAMVDATQ